MGREVEIQAKAVSLRTLQARERTLQFIPIVMGSQRKNLFSYTYFLCRGVAFLKDRSCATSASRAAAAPLPTCPPRRPWAGASSPGTRCPAAPGTRRHQLRERRQGKHQGRLSEAFPDLATLGAPAALKAEGQGQHVLGLQVRTGASEDGGESTKS